MYFKFSKLSLSSLCESRASSRFKRFKRGSSCVWSEEDEARGCKDMLLSFA